jgi:glycosyltransferase involved in cell wall biosynthesis
MAKSASPEPEISVVIPTHGRPGLLPGLFERLRAQTMAPERFEVVVVNDCSPDDTSEVLGVLAAAAPFHVEVTRTLAQGGPAVARNVGWRSARAPLVAFIDDDVTPVPGWLEAAVTAFGTQRKAGVMQGTTRVPPENEAVRARWGPPDWDHYHSIEGPTAYFQGCNIFFRREVLEKTGGFDEDIGWWGEDTAAGWKALEAGWERGFCADAMVFHSVERRGWAWFVRHGVLEANMVRLAVEYPGFRQMAFHRWWSLRREDSAFKVAVLGALLGLRFRPALLLALPYLWWQRPSVRHLNFFRLCWQVPAVDAARSYGQIRGALAYRTIVI